MKRAIYTAIASLLIVGACASAPATTSTGIAIVNPAPAGKMAKQWDKASKDIAKGEKLIASGQNTLDKGEKLERKARKDLRKGEDMIADGQADISKGERKIADAKARQLEIETAIRSTEVSEYAPPLVQGAGAN
jgi:Skp family chaperone for outer membrane proteins